MITHFGLTNKEIQVGQCERSKQPYPQHEDTAQVINIKEKVLNFHAAQKQSMQNQLLVVWNPLIN